MQRALVRWPTLSPLILNVLMREWRSGWALSACSSRIASPTRRAKQRLVQGHSEATVQRASHCKGPPAEGRQRRAAQALESQRNLVMLLVARPSLPAAVVPTAMVQGASVRTDAPPRRSVRGHQQLARPHRISRLRTRKVLLWPRELRSVGWKKRMSVLCGSARSRLRLVYMRVRMADGGGQTRV